MVVTFAVTDDGPGIPPDGRPTCSSASVASTRRGPLIVVAPGSAWPLRRLVEQHGGTIGVDPAHDAGARFVVTLPATGV